MQIIEPKKRGLLTSTEYKKLEADAFKIVQKNNSIPFKQYCQLSFYCIEQEDKFFQNNENWTKRLKTPNINYNFSLTAKQQGARKQEEEQTKKIVEILAYAWNNIINLIESKGRNNTNQNLGIYSDENINIHFARLEQMLKELKGHRYRCSVYLKQHAYSKEIAEKEMKEELIFIQLLQNILKSQTNKIQEARTNPIPIREEHSKSDQKEEESVQRLQPIPTIIDVNKYFSNKYASTKDTTQSKDVIDLQQQKRRFNSAVIRYHLQNSTRR